MMDNFLPFLHCSLDFLGFSNIPGLEVGGYLDCVLNSTPYLYYGIILLSLAVVTWGYAGGQGESVQEDITGQLDNEVEVSQVAANSSEIRPVVRSEFATEQSRGDDSEDYTDSNDDSVNGEVLSKAKDFVNIDDLSVLDDVSKSPSSGSLMSRVKKARQRAIRNAVEREMTAEDKLREQMAANQMLARVYSVMKENEEVFGDTKFDDVKSQMDLYKD